MLYEAMNFIITLTILIIINYNYKLIRPGKDFKSEGINVFFFSGHITQILAQSTTLPFYSVYL
jgi:hypothetical protein